MKYRIYMDNQSRVTKIVYADKVWIRFHYAGDGLCVRKTHGKG